MTRLCAKPAAPYKPSTDFLGWHERDEIRKEVFERDPPLCVWCLSLVSDDHRSGIYFTADHVVPRSEGGAYTAENLVLACKTCNMERGKMSVLAYMVHRARQSGAPDDQPGG